MLKAGENRFRDDMVAVTNRMAARRHRNVVTFRNPGPKLACGRPRL